MPLLRAVIAGLAIGAAMVLPAASAHADSAVVFDGLRTLGLSASERTSMHAHVLDGRGGPAIVAGDTGAAETCGTQRRCHCRAARQHGGDRALFGNVGRIGDLYTFELVVIDAQSCDVERAVFVSERHSEASAMRRLGELAQSVTTPVDAMSSTAARDEREAALVPTPVTTLGARQLRDVGVSSVTDAIALAPGFEVLDANWGHQVLVGGLSRTLLFMIDGVPIATAQNHIRTLPRDFQVGLHGFDRIELVRGPGSVLWGANALLGAVNLISAEPNRRGVAATAEVEVSSQGTVDASASVKQRQRRYGYSLSATLRRSQGPETVVDDSLYANVLSPAAVWGNAGTASPVTDNHAQLLARVTALDRLRLSLAHIQYTDHFEISPFGSLLPEATPGVWDKRHRIYAARWDDDIGDAVSYGLSASRYELLSKESFVIHPASADGFEDGLRSVQGHPVDPVLTHLGEARMAARLAEGPVASSLQVGAGYRHERTPDSLATVVGVMEEPGEPTVSFTARSFHTAFAYALETLTLLDRLSVSGGARYELRNRATSGLTTQAGATLRLGRVSAKLSYAEGFRPPTALQLLSTVGTQGNPDLEPETSRQLAAEIAVAAAAPLELRVGGSATRLSRLIVNDPAQADPGFAYLPVNRGRMDLAVGYLEARVRVGGLIDGFANVAIKHLDQDASGGPEVPVARYTGSAGVAWWPTSDVRVFARAAATSARMVDALVPTPMPMPEVVERQRVAPALRYALGFALTNLWRGLDVDVVLSNPLRTVRDTPYAVDGRPSPLIERRIDSELLARLRWSL